MGDKQSLDGRLFFHYDALLASLRWFDYAERFRFRACGNRTKQLFHFLRNFIAVEIADDYERGIARMIPLVVVSLHIGSSSRFQVFDPSDGRPVIRVLA